MLAKLSVGLYFSLLLVMKIGMCDLVIFCLATTEVLTHCGFMDHIKNKNTHVCMEIYGDLSASWIIG